MRKEIMQIRQGDYLPLVICYAWEKEIIRFCTTWIMAAANKSIHFCLISRIDNLGFFLMMADQVDELDTSFFQLNSVDDNINLSSII